jgi:sialic acid synthase SpsE
MAVLAAVARGAKIIEKHITILRDVPNAQDWKVSAGPDNLAKLVADVRRIEQQLGSKIKQAAPSERDAERWATKSLVAARRLPAGHLLADADIAVKRPGTGIAPSKKATVIGRRLNQALDADALILPEHLA